MLKIKRILFPVDLSPQSRAVAPHVRAMASSFGAELDVLNVLEVPPGYYKDWDAYLTLVNWDAIKEDRQRGFARFVEQAFDGMPVTSFTEEGDPAQTIVNYAKTQSIDLIMMPTYGARSFRSLLIGSVTAKVLHDTEIPVWTSAHSTDPAPAVHASCRHILCVVDVTEKFVPLVKWAAGLSRQLKASLRLVHAIPGADAVDTADQSYLFDKARSALACLQQAAGVNVEACVAAGEVAHVVRQEALQHKANLVVIGRGHIDATLGRLRTNAYTIIRESPCPVVSV